MTRILIIDDDVEFSSFLRASLEKDGAGVDCLDAASGAPELLSQADYDVVLLDNRMPGLSGIEFLAALKQRDLSVPVILMTGDPTSETAIQAMNLGAFDYVVKPLNTQLMAKALASGLAHTGDASPIHKKLGTMVAFVGTRGGVGTTTLAVNMAWYLANRQSRRVALVDLDLQNGDCALALDIKPNSGLREALGNPLRIDNTLLERVMTPVGERLFVLSSEEPLTEDLHFTAVAVETLVSALREQFHYVIVDVPRIPAAPYRRALEMADFRVMVADQTLRSVRDTVRLRTAIGEGEGKRPNFLVVNRHGEGGRHAVTLNELQHVVEVKPKSVIPFQPTLFTTISGGAKIAVAQRAKFTDAIAALALELSGRPPERRRWWRADR